MSQFTTTDSLRFRSYLVAHGVDAATAQKVANKTLRKANRNKQFTAEEAALIEVFMARRHASPSTVHAVAMDTITKKSGHHKYSHITLKRGYTSYKDLFSYNKHKGEFNFKVEIAGVSEFPPAMVRQLAYKAAIS